MEISVATELPQQLVMLIFKSFMFSIMPIVKFLGVSSLEYSGPIIDLLFKFSES